MDLLNKADPSGDEVSNLKSQLADMATKNTALTEQLKNALEGKVDDVKEFMSNLSIQDETTAMIRELTTQNEKLQSIVSELQEKIPGLTGMAGALTGGVSASAAGAGGAAERALDNTADQASEAADAAKDQAAEAAAEAQKQAEEAPAEAEKAAKEEIEKAEEAAAAAASAVGSITSGFGW